MIHKELPYKPNQIGLRNGTDQNTIYEIRKKNDEFEFDFEKLCVHIITHEAPSV